MKLLTKIVAQLIIFFVGGQGWKLVQWLLNQPNDLAVFGGTIFLVVLLFLIGRLTIYVWRPNGKVVA